MRGGGAIVLLGPVYIAALVCRELYYWLYRQSNDDARSRTIGAWLGAPLGALISAGPLYLCLAHEHFRGGTCPEVCIAVLAIVGAVVGLRCGSGKWRK